uniref:G-protein coupled receptors family 3 profile domain-containing protein n=1 Tax=Denticeps clupeoides TaxID=299321 RepID=A0AAY4DQN1_9TELE
MWKSKVPSLTVFLIHWVLGFQSVVWKETSASCRLQGTFNPHVLYMEGDFVIGGVFSLHPTVRIVEHNYTRQPEPTHFARAMEFAIKEINSKQDLLPNITLGYQMHDSCTAIPMAVNAAFQLANGQDAEIVTDASCPKVASVAAVVGDSTSASSIGMSRILGLFGIPQVSHFATCSCLSNKQQYPTFFRTVPSDNFQAAALAQVVKYFGWKWIGAVRSNTDYGNSGMASFLRVAEKEGICIEYSVAFVKTDPLRKVKQIADIIRHSTARVIVAFVQGSDLRVLLSELIKEPQPRLQWIGSEGWMIEPDLLNFGLFSGAIGFSFEAFAMPGFRQFLLDLSAIEASQTSLLKEFWEDTFGCKLQGEITQMGLEQGVRVCTGSENLNNVNSFFTDTSQMRVVNMVYKATYAIAHALHGVVCNSRQQGLPNCNKSMILEPHQLKKVNFTVNGYSVMFNSNGDPANGAIYELINWQVSKEGKLQFVTVGHYDASQPKDHELRLIRNITWLDGRTEVPASVCNENCPPGTRKAAQKGKPICCYDCVAWLMLYIPPSTTIKIKINTYCVSCPDEFWPNSQRDKCLPKPIEFLAWDEVLGIILTVCSITGTCMVVAVTGIFYRHRTSPIVRANNSELSFLLLFSLTLCFLCSLTFIGRPTESSCMLRHTAFGITFVLCISCILVKTIVVLMAFRATLPGSNVMKLFGPPQQRMTVVGFSSVQVLVCILWLVLSPPFPIKNMSHYKERIILECNLGSAGAFWAVLGYIGLLAVLCFVLAFLARKLPDNFNEAKFITFSMLIFCAVWITFIPAYVSSPGKFTVALEIFAILASSFGLMTCIYFPKCYIILLKPEQNTKKHLMGKVPSKSL